MIQGVTNSWSPLEALTSVAVESQGLEHKQESSQYWLSIQPQPPKYPFVDVFFPFTLFLIDNKKNLRIGAHIKLELELFYENGEKVKDQSILEIHHATPPIIDGKGSAELKIRVKQVSMVHSNRAFCIRASSSADSPSRMSIYPAQSTNFYVVRHRLKILRDPSLPKVWYKDEGGKDKCLTLNAMLVDEQEKPVCSREVPLKVTLCYHNEELGPVEVKKQEILRMSSDTVCNVDKTGRVSLRLRIEEVSKNHQKQSFCIKVAPDAAFSPANFDISPDLSSAVTVLSKRNKRKTMSSKLSRSPIHSSIPAPLSIGSSSSSSGTSSSGSGLGGISSLTSGVSNGDSSGSLTSSGSPIMPSPKNSPRERPLKRPNLSRTASLPPVSDAPIDTKTLELLRASPPVGPCARGIISWCQYVVKGLQNMEWQHVGFEVTDDGNMNLNRPLYRCPGCWAYKDNLRDALHNPTCVISQALRTYQSTVAFLLTELVHHAFTVPNLSLSADGLGSMLPPALAPILPLSSVSESKSQSSTGALDDDFSLTNPSSLTVDLPIISSSLSSSSSSSSSNHQSSGFSFITHESSNSSLSSLSSLGDSGESKGKDRSPTLPPMTPFTFHVKEVAEAEKELGSGIDQSELALALEETHVHSILVLQTPYGLPTFNQQGDLSGFYQYEESPSYLGFVALSAYKGEIEQQVHDIMNLYEKHKRSGSKSILSKQDYITIENLKESALLQHFQEANSFFS